MMMINRVGGGVEEMGGVTSSHMPISSIPNMVANANRGGLRMVSQRSPNFLLPPSATTPMQASL